MSTFGLHALWVQGDLISRITLFVLLGMSTLSWTLLLAKTVEYLRLSRQGARVDAHFWEARDLESGAHLLGPQGSGYQALYLAATQAMAHHTAHPHHLHTRLDVGDWLARALKVALDDRTAALQRGLAVLASIASTAPFIGLFGTVWGVYHALVRIGAGQAVGLAQVAGPIGEALVMTALGLFVAVPAALAYNALGRAARVQQSKLARFAQGLHALLLTGANTMAPSVVRLSPVAGARA